MGGSLPGCTSSAATEGSANLQRMRNSRPPGKFLMRQSMASFSGTYTALPCRNSMIHALAVTAGAGTGAVLLH